MPHDIEIEFGKRTVAEGLITQKKLDEAILLLHNLEMAGSDKKLWDLLVDKGLIKPTDVTRLRAVPSAEGKPATSPSGRAEGTFLIVYLPEKQEAQFHRLLHRPLNIGSDKKSDIIIEEAGVDERHARITSTDRGPTIWDVGTEFGVVTNGVRKTTSELHAGDLIKIGEALLVVLFEPHGKSELPEPFSEGSVEGDVTAKFHIETGASKGQTIFVGMRPMIIGRHRLATAHMEQRHVTPLHTHLLPSSRGIQVTDLRSAIGTRVNELIVTETVLNNGDSLRIGELRLRFESTGKLLEQRAREETEEESEPVSVPEIPSDVEFEIESDDSGMELDADKPSREVTERYKPGELVLTAIEGPIEGKFVVIKKSKLFIGRAGTSDVFIPDLSVSRKHAVITLSKAGLLEIEDLDSTNGIYVNNRQVRKAALKTGDAIRIGSTSLIVDRRSS